MALAPQDPLAGAGGYKPLAEINVTPFVDVMLVLLIIFMISAPLMMAGVPVELPKTVAAKVSQPKKPIIVSLTREGEFYVRDVQVEEDSLVPYLVDLRAVEGTDTLVYVRGDRGIDYGSVMRVLGQVGQAGFSKVSLIAQSPETGDAR
jgi:biopolymer transport protein TolR